MKKLLFLNKEDIFILNDFLGFYLNFDMEKFSASKFYCHKLIQLRERNYSLSLPLSLLVNFDVDNLPCYSCGATNNSTKREREIILSLSLSLSLFSLLAHVIKCKFMHSYITFYVFIPINMLIKTCYHGLK